MLPAWLGTGRALNNAMNDGFTPVIQDMRDNWPYFQTLLDMSRDGSWPNRMPI
ncbi:MAG: phosphoenolpyruvate carboxylase [Moraxellaceae bacterium]|nr:phosphoenolpyruvate carboxylase [Moraxellaceae bacterium]